MFHIDGKPDHAAKCVKSSIITKVIDFVISINKFEQQCVVLKGMLQSPRIKYHMKTIGIDQLLSHGALFEHTCLQNIKILYKCDGKCDDQQQFKYILEVAMVYTSEGFNNSSPRSPMILTPVKKPSARKSLCLFTNILDAKKKILSVYLDNLNQSA